MFTFKLTLGKSKDSGWITFAGTTVTTSATGKLKSQEEAHQERRRTDSAVEPKEEA